jgi:hypothetical protein
MLREQHLLKESGVVTLDDLPHPLAAHMKHGGNLGRRAMLTDQVGELLIPPGGEARRQFAHRMARFGPGRRRGQERFLVLARPGSPSFAGTL